MIARGCLGATEEVKVEIDKRDDELKEIKQRPDFFVAHEYDVQLAVRDALLHCKNTAFKLASSGNSGSSTPNRSSWTP
jgi:hypothetical protein